MRREQPTASQPRPGNLSHCTSVKFSLSRITWLTLRPSPSPRPPALQPPLADAESVRDAVIARLFQDLGRQGLDAHHPFAAYGDGAGGEEQTRKKGGGLRRLLSMGSRKEEKASRGVRGTRL